MAKPAPAEKIRAWRALMHVHSSVTSAMDDILRAELGIPGSWYEALVEIAFAGGTMRMNEFAEETTLTKSGATRFVDRLVRAGLVVRQVCPTDRRVLQLALTPEGRRVQKAADPLVLRVIEEEFSRHISDDEARVMLEALTRTRLQTSHI
ncbi:MAG TPA: MarR family transcriptional regulator [Acidimicrobiia bacterium]|nr:MarR family transcriptional regulator [Acidimicrobiia bacterium]